MKEFIEKIYDNKISKENLKNEFEEIVSKEYSAKQLSEVVLFIKNKQKIIVDLPIENLVVLIC